MPLQPPAAACRRAAGAQRATPLPLPPSPHPRARFAREARPAPHPRARFDRGTLTRARFGRPSVQNVLQSASEDVRRVVPASRLRDSPGKPQVEGGVRRLLPRGRAVHRRCGSDSCTFRPSGVSFGAPVRVSRANRARVCDPPANRARARASFCSPPAAYAHWVLAQEAPHRGCRVRRTRVRAPAPARPAAASVGLAAAATPPRSRPETDGHGGARAAPASPGRAAAGESPTPCRPRP